MLLWHQTPIHSANQVNTFFLQDCVECCKISVTGDGSNRWFDKSFTSVAFPGGIGAMNVEHSVLDATVRSDIPRSV